MKSLLRYLLYAISFSLASLAVSFFIIFATQAVTAWQGPTSNPISGNTSTPLLSNASSLTLGSQVIANFLTLQESAGSPANFYVDSKKSLQLRVDSDQATAADNAAFAVNNGANNAVLSVDETGLVTFAGRIANGSTPAAASDAATKDYVDQVHALYSVPGAPQNLVITSAPSEVHEGDYPYPISLTWQTPSSSGAGPIINYKVYRDGGVIASPVPVNYSDNNYNNNNSCYQVSAINSAGEGAKSNQVCTNITFYIKCYPDNDRDGGGAEGSSSSETTDPPGCFCPVNSSADCPIPPGEFIPAGFCGDNCEVDNNGDCNDNDATINHYITCYEDHDCDGEKGTPVQKCVSSCESVDLASSSEDCDDSSECHGISANHTTDCTKVSADCFYSGNSDGDQCVGYCFNSPVWVYPEQVSGYCESQGGSSGGCPGSGFDCNDGDSGVCDYRYCYTDNDGDGHGGGGAQWLCSSSCITSADDCDDSPETGANIWWWVDCYQRDWPQYFDEMMCKVFDPNCPL